MRNQLETFRTLFQQVRGLGIVMQLPNDNHTKLSKNITVYFADNYEVTSVAFGDRYEQQVDIMRYSTHDENYRVSFQINITDESLMELLEIVKVEFMDVKFNYLDGEIEKLQKYRDEDDLVVLERGEVVV